VDDDHEGQVIQLGTTGCLLTASAFMLFLTVYGALSLWADYGW